jgi:hypothetical protein
MGNKVPLLDVIRVLQAHGITVTQVTVKPNTYTVEGNGVLEEIILLDWVNRKRLDYLKRKFNIAVHLFWHPEECPPATTGTAPTLTN